MSTPSNDPSLQLQQALAAIDALQKEVALLHALLEKSVSSAPVAAPAPTTAPRTFAKVNPPKEFTGSSRDARPFITQCELVFRIQPEAYNTEERCILYACSYLRKDAFLWYQSLVAGLNAPEITDFVEFKELFLTQFGGGNIAQTARDALKTLYQKNRATEYINIFNQHAVLTEYNEAAKMEYFHDGLSAEVIDLLITMPPAKTLTELQQNAITCDALIARRDLQKARRNNSRYPSRSQTPASSFSTCPATMSPPVTRNSDVSPMDLSQIQRPPVPHGNSKKRGPLTPEEHARRAREKLCLYCGEASCPGSANVEHCPKLIRKNSGNATRQA